MSEETAEASRLRGSGPQEGAGEGAGFMQADGQGQHWCPPAPVSEERAEMDKGCLPVPLSLQGDLQSRPSSTGPRASEHACPGGKQALFTGGLRRCARPHGRLAVTALRPSATSVLLLCRPDVTGAHAPGPGPRGAACAALDPSVLGEPLAVACLLLGGHPTEHAGSDLPPRRCVHLSSHSWLWRTCSASLRVIL